LQRIQKTFGVFGLASFLVRFNGLLQSHRRDFLIVDEHRNFLVAFRCRLEVAASVLNVAIGDFRERVKASLVQKR
jgi:hypothetical protein